MEEQNSKVNENMFNLRSNKNAVGLKPNNILDWTLLSNLNLPSWNSLSTSLFNILKYLIFIFFKGVLTLKHIRKYNFLCNKGCKVYYSFCKQWAQIANCLFPLWDRFAASLMRRECKLTLHMEMISLMTLWIETCSSLIPWLLTAKR